MILGQYHIIPYSQNLQKVDAVDIIALLDKNLNEVVTYSYDSWGKLINVTGTLASTIGTINPYRYRGYRYDTETGLYYLNSRYYNPDLGRFVNADGIADTGQGVLGTNMYAYCGNNPVDRSDPSGSWWINSDGTIGYDSWEYSDPSYLAAHPVPGNLADAMEDVESASSVPAAISKGTIVVAQEGTGSGNRLRATMTVYKNAIPVATFNKCSTLPDYPQGKWNGKPVATINSGMYTIKYQPTGNHPIAYRVYFNGSDETIPCMYWDIAGTANAILVHEGTDVRASDPERAWSAGCLLVNKSDIVGFHQVVGDSATLYIVR